MPSVTTGTAVLLPGAGSDEEFVSSAFARPLAAVGFRLVAIPPTPGPDLISHYLRALDRVATATGPILVGGVSLGGHLAVEWALCNQHRCTGLLAALPAWCGDPGDAPAAVAARWNATLVRAQGLDAALAIATRDTPAWLTAELNRSWRRHGAGLAVSLAAAAAHPAPTEEQLRGLTVPVGIAACTDDPVHPPEVAGRWVRALPQVARRDVTLSLLGADPESLGRAAVLAWLRAAHPRHAGQGTTDHRTGDRERGDGAVSEPFPRARHTQDRARTEAPAGPPVRGTGRLPTAVSAGPAASAGPAGPAASA